MWLATRPVRARVSFFASARRSGSIPAPKGSRLLVAGAVDDRPVALGHILVAKTCAHQVGNLALCRSALNGPALVLGYSCDHAAGLTLGSSVGGDRRAAPARRVRGLDHRRDRVTLISNWWRSVIKCELGDALLKHLGVQRLDHTAHRALQPAVVEQRQVLSQQGRPGSMNTCRAVGRQ